MKLYFIAGEYSGDFIGSKIIKAFKCQYDFEKVQMYGVGGELMAKEGIDSLFDIAEINIMGFFEIIPRIYKIKKLIDKTIEDIISKKPDMLITIDSPGFTYRVAKRIRTVFPGIKLIHIVAPSVWAYKERRAKKYAQLYDCLLTILPFEPEYFLKHGLKTYYIGHPFLEQNFLVKSQLLRQQMRIADDVKIIAITPGSRRGEVIRHMPVIRQALDIVAITNKVKVFFVQPNDKHIQLIAGYLNDVKFDYSFSTDKLSVFAVSDCALAKSGTNVLEIAASKTPLIIGYKMNSLSFILIKSLINIKFACLLNIVAGWEIIPEYIQNDFTADNLSFALCELLSNGQKANNQINEAHKVLKSLGLGANTLPSANAANIIYEVIKNKT